MVVELFTILLVILVFASSGYSDEQIEIQARALRGIVFLIQRNIFLYLDLKKVVVMCRCRAARRRD